MTPIKERLLTRILDTKRKAVKRMNKQKYAKFDYYTKKDGTKELCWCPHYVELVAAELLVTDDMSNMTWVPTQVLNSKEQAKRLNISGMDLVKYPHTPIKWDDRLKQFVNVNTGIDVKYQPRADVDFNSVSIEWATWDGNKFNTYKGSTLYHSDNQFYFYVTKKKGYLFRKNELKQLITDLDIKPKECQYTDKRMQNIVIPLHQLEKICLRIYDIPEEDVKNLEQYDEQ